MQVHFLTANHFYPYENRSNAVQKELAVRLWDVWAKLPRSGSFSKIATFDIRFDFLTYLWAKGSQIFVSAVFTYLYIYGIIKISNCKILFLLLQFKQFAEHFLFFFFVFLITGFDNCIALWLDSILLVCSSISCSLLPLLRSRLLLSSPSANTSRFTAASKSHFRVKEPLSEILSVH